MARTKLSCRMKCGGLPPRPRSDTVYMSALSESSESTLQSESGSESETPPRSTKRSRMSGEEAGAEVRALAVPCVVHRKGKRLKGALPRRCLLVSSLPQLASPQYVFVFEECRR